MIESMNDPTTAVATFSERRREPRLRSLLTGTVVFNAHKATLDCTVRSISAHGAKVVLAEAFRMPDEFELSIPHHDQVHRATVIWRKGERAGLALTDVEKSVHSARPRLTPRQAERARMRELASAI